MAFVEYPETQLVPSGEATGSMAVSYQSKLVSSHAVAREDDGTPRDKARREPGIRLTCTSGVRYVSRLPVARS
jgi:hypothetical protein